MARPKNPDRPTVRTYRVSPRAWEQGRKRAAAEGTTISAATGELVEGYARGIYNLPEKRIVRTFPAQDEANGENKNAQD